MHLNKIYSRINIQAIKNLCQFAFQNTELQNPHLLHFLHTEKVHNTLVSLKSFLEFYQQRGKTHKATAISWTHRIFHTSEYTGVYLGMQIK